MSFIFLSQIIGSGAFNILYSFVFLCTLCHLLYLFLFCQPFLKSPPFEETIGISWALFLYLNENDFIGQIISCVQYNANIFVDSFRGFQFLSSGGCFTLSNSTLDIWLKFIASNTYDVLKMFGEHLQCITTGRAI